MTWFRLARTLGVSVKQCKEQIDSKEFTQWLVYFMLDPPREVRSTNETALICLTIASFAYSLGGKKGQKPKMEDFFLKYGDYLSVEQEDKEAQVEGKLKMWLTNYQQSKDYKK